MSWLTYQLLTWIWIALGGATFLYLLRIAAPFGRHTRSGWGPTIDNRLGWIIMEGTVLVVLYLSFFGSKSDSMPSLPVVVILGLFSAHYLHRSMIFPWFLRTKGKRMPVIITLSAMGFNTINGFLFGYYLGRFADYPAGWFQDPRFLLGGVLFCLGAWINVRTDYQLIRLRAPGETGYKIPKGFWFNYLSCPNHAGEILEWVGFALLSWSLPGLAFACWTFANLAPRAVAHHRWYQEHFPDYPKRRKAILPLIW